MNKYSYVRAVIIIFILWELLSLGMNSYLVPSIFTILHAFINMMFTSRDIYEHIFSSLYRIVIGIFIGLVPALIFGIVLYYSKVLDKYLGAAFDILYIIPKVVFLPIIMVILGIGDLSKIFLIALILFFQQTVIIRDGVKAIPSDIWMLMKNYNVNFIQAFRHFILPYIIPNIMTGLRMSVGTAFALLFISESYASVSGLGYFITNQLSIRDFPVMYAGILVLSILGCLLYGLISLIEKKLSWK